MKKIETVFLFAAFIVVLGSASSVFAAEDEATPWTKLERGAVNMTTGWVEPAVQAAEGAEEDSPVAGVFTGFGKGILKGLQRTGMGLADTLSFPLGPYNRPAMEPETLLSSK